MIARESDKILLDVAGIVKESSNPKAHLEGLYDGDQMVIHRTKWGFHILKYRIIVFTFLVSRSADYIHPTENHTHFGFNLHRITGDLR